MSLRLACRAVGRCVVLAVVLVIASASPASAQCGAGAQLCAPGVGDCTISADCTLTIPAGGLLIPLGNRRLVLTKNLKIAGPPGAGLTITARDVLLNGGSITALGDNSTAGTIAILSETNFTVQNNTLIDVSAGVVAGVVDFEALAGDMNFAGRIRANGTTRASFGGEATLFAAGNANVSGSMLDVSGGDMGSGGSIDILALDGSLMAAIPLNAKGGDGGSIDLSAGTTLTTTSATTMDLSATGDAGSGGDIDINAVGNVTVGGETNSTGTPAASSEEGQSGGDGGEYDVASDTGSVTVNGKVTLNGAAAGFGGAVDWEAATDLSFTKTIVAQSDGIDGGGGDVFLFAGGTLALPQQIDVRGGTGSGGSIDALSEGSLTASATLLTDGQLAGGSIFLSGCAVNITSAATLQSLAGAGVTIGSNTVQASSTMTIAGKLKATAAGNLLQYRSAPAPVLTGSTITPPPVIQLLPMLPCCLNCPVTTTTTSTIATTTTTSSTTTTTLANVCGNGQVTGTEQCDDGNTVGGDCCSPTCTFEPANSPCADDNNACTRDVCNGAAVCTHPAGNAGATCRPAAGMCDQAETCSGTSPTCPSDAKQTGPCRPSAGACDVVESCDGTSNACPPDGFAPATTPCRDAAGACDIAESCTGTSAACPADVHAPNGTTCGADACNTAGSCQGGVCTGSQAITCNLCQTCDAVLGCVTGPRPTCRNPVEPEAAQLKLKDSSKGPSSDQLQWKWNKGAATALADFGDPVTNDSLVLCIFDRSQATPSLLFGALVPAGGTCDGKPCWTGKGKNFKFKSKDGEPDGATALTLTPGAAGKAKIQFKAKGLALTGRPVGLPSLPLPLPLTVQLQSTNGQCWGASFAPGGVKKNTGEDFDAKSQ